MPFAPPDAPAPAARHHGAAALLLNVAHALDHLMLLVFATAVSAIAADFGMARWEDLMPYAAGAFVMFGLGSLPAGRLGDLWGRRAMMLVFYFGIGLSSMLVAATQSPWQIAAALTLMGAFSSIYHPVGIPMLVQGATRPGWVIGINGLAGNLGIAAAALSTGLLVKYVGWRAAFVVPGLAAIACGIAFARIAPREAGPPARRAPRQVELPPALVARVLLALTLTSTTGALIFNFTTNGNAELLRERMQAITTDPARLGVLLAGVYVVASFAQLVVGRAIDRFPLKRLLLAIVAVQVPLFLLASRAEGWALYGLAIACMAFVFGAIPFTDAIIVRYVDDRSRSRVAGLRLAVSFGISSLAVWLLGPFVKSAGFDALFVTMALIAAGTLLGATLLPRTRA
ncbi:MAG TPA: MFS transporter [Casimicrobiaceae bacterium]|nr:MFS transporter [Casimicrobiaceae bacterium]